MKRNELTQLARRLLRRDWEVLLLFVIGLLLLLSLEIIGLTPEKDSQYPLIRNLIATLNVYREKVLPVFQPLSIIAFASYLFLPLSVKSRRALVDFFMMWFIVRVLDMFVLINLLIFLESHDHAQLIIQLLLFLPCLLLMWGWIYWRTDARILIATGKRMYTFKLPEDSAPTIYDYFLVSFTSLISHTLSGFSGETRTARTLIFLHGVMMWDVMGLMLSRTIALVSD